MAVAKSTTGKWRTYTGTAAEVSQALADDGVNVHETGAIVWDATANKHVAFVAKGRKSS